MKVAPPPRKTVAEPPPRATRLTVATSSRLDDFQRTISAAAVLSTVKPESVETNIVVVDTGATPAAPIAAAAADQGVRVSALGPRLIRAVTHLDVTKDDCERAGTILGNLLGGQ